MKSGDVVGRRIVRIHQTRCVTNTGDVRMLVSSITLDDGTVLMPEVIRLPDDDAPTIYIVKPGADA
jgi:hypothetical protein